MLKLILFTEKTVTSKIIKGLEQERTVSLILFKEGEAKEGIKRILEKYTDAYPNSFPELLTWVEGDREDAAAIQEKFEKLVDSGSIRFVDKDGNLSSTGH